MTKLWLCDDDAANELLTNSPLALLIGLVLDQQVPMDRAFKGPYLLAERLGRELDCEFLATADEDQLVKTFSEFPALHRFPGAMAKRVQALCQQLMAEYAGDAAEVWNGASSGQELLKRVRALPGFGDEKARIFVAFLGKQLGVTPPDWQRASQPFGEPDTFRSIADIDGPEAFGKVRAFKAEMKAARAAKKSSA